MPHVGRTGDGVTYAMGCCGTGVALMTNLGTKVGAWLAGGEAPALASLRFPLVPAPRRRPSLLLLPRHSWRPSLLPGRAPGCRRPRLPLHMRCPRFPLAPFNLMHLCRSMACRPGLPIPSRRCRLVALRRRHLVSSRFHRSSMALPRLRTMDSTAHLEGGRLLRHRLPMLLQGAGRPRHLPTAPLHQLRRLLTVPLPTAGIRRRPTVLPGGGRRLSLHLLLLPVPRIWMYMRRRTFHRRRLRLWSTLGVPPDPSTSLTSYR
jgi:hypothetical protein